VAKNIPHHVQYVNLFFVHHAIESHKLVSREAFIGLFEAGFKATNRHLT
jgi:hypothetical protein